MYFYPGQCPGFLSEEPKPRAKPEPKPWKAGKRVGVRFTCGAVDDLVEVFAGVEAECYATGKKTAERIALCVNFLAGVSAAQLEEAMTVCPADTADRLRFLRDVIRLGSP